MSASVWLGRVMSAVAMLGVISVRAQVPALARASIRVENPLALVRHDETVSVPWSDLQRRLSAATAATVRVLDAEGREVPSQAVDGDGNGTIDALLFQADFTENELRHFTVEATAPTQKYRSKAYAYHDLERDDVAWESDRMAFRIYGEGLKKTSSAMSSAGIDIWNKRTRALIIDKWYAKGHDSYHVDTGEGADFYDVNETLGNGGTAGWARDSIWRSDNFKEWRIIANGPIRGIFELTYAPFDVAGVVAEVKRIAIDAGSNVYRATSTLTTPKGGEITYVIGTVKRPGMNGTVSRKNTWAWLTGWGPVALKSGSHGEMGTAVLLPSTSVVDWKEAFGH